MVLKSHCICEKERTFVNEEVEVEESRSRSSQNHNYPKEDFRTAKIVGLKLATRFADLAQI
jgi:hypothetical protein